MASESKSSDRYQPNERIEVVPIGEIGDGGVWLRHNPNPPSHRSKFELEYDWGYDVDRVFLGDEGHLRNLVDVLQRYVDTGGDGS